MRIFIILNPCAGAGRSRDIWPQIESFLQASGVDFITRITTGPGDADRLAAQSELSTFDALVAAGGDGTLFEVVNGLYRRNPGERPPLGVIPIGTGNAFARDLGLAPGDWRAAVERLLSAPVRRIDVGRVSSGLECFYFVNIIGLGFPVDAAVTARKLKWLGRGAYTLATLWRVLRLRSHPLCMELDGRRIEGDKVFVEISNTRYTGTHFLIAPAARMDDGLLDVSILPAPQEVVGTLRELMNNGWGLDAMFVRARLPWVDIKVAQGLYINLDGEPLEGDDLHFKALPKALRVHLPMNSPLVVQADDLLAHGE